MSRYYSRMIFFLSTMLWVMSAYPYDNKITHRALTEASFRASIIGKQTKYLIDIIGEGYFNNSVVVVNSETISYWFQDGADFEDELPEDEKSCRAANHFHNPIKGWQDGMILPWDQAQMTKKCIQPIAAFVGCGKRQAHPPQMPVST